MNPILLYEVSDSRGQIQMGSAADQPVTQVKSVVVSLQLCFVFVRCRHLAGALIHFPSPTCSARSISSGHILRCECWPWELIAWQRAAWSRLTLCLSIPISCVLYYVYRQMLAVLLCFLCAPWNICNGGEISGRDSGVATPSSSVSRNLRLNNARVTV